MNTVILKKVSQGFGIGQIINGNNFHFSIKFVHLTKKTAANAAKSIDGNSDGHRVSLLKTNDWLAIIMQK
jgi:hypothetical protein